MHPGHSLPHSVCIMVLHKSLYIFPLTQFFQMLLVPPPPPPPLLSCSRSPACSRLRAIFLYFSLVNILSRLSSIIFIQKECICPTVDLSALFTVQHLCFRWGDTAHLGWWWWGGFYQRMRIVTMNFHELVRRELNSGCYSHL